MFLLSQMHGIERLGVFLSDVSSGKPLVRVPVYAEIALGGGRLILPETKGIDEIRAHAPQLEPMVAEEIQAWFGSADRSDVDEYWPASILVAIRASLESKGLLKADADIERARDVTKTVIAEYAAEKQVPRAEGDDVRRFPLGLLSTDHTGFVSFDLLRAGLPSPDKHGLSDRQRVQALVYPYQADSLMTDVAVQGRIAPDAIVGKIAIDPVFFVNAPALNLPALQNPSLIDWRLSPGSFAATPVMLVGEDGCQSYTPANFATSQVSIRQIVRIEGEVERGFPAARVLEYTVSFIPIGHSLGQMLYSLPLAPGETTRLAVVNWRRSDAGQRTEDTALTESLIHDQTRDRLISETVEAALDEWQRGGSVMGGMAHGSGSASGGNASAKLFNVIGLGAGAGNATGDMMSAGGAYSTSSGTRDLSVDTIQKLTDRIHQASTAVREIHGTVVVQTDQAESQNIETRAFANNNRGHTLNILYHEVLQHFRVVTEYKRKYAAVLLPRAVRNFEDDAFIIGMRHNLEPITLDETLKPAGYDAVRAIDFIRKDQNRQLTWQAPFWQGDIVFKRFIVQIRVNDDNTGNEVRITLFRFSAPLIALLFDSSEGPTFDFNKDDDFEHENVDSVLHTVDLDVGVPWWDVDKLELRMMATSGDVRIMRADVFGLDEAGNSHRLFWGENINVPLENANSTAALSVIRQTPLDRPVPTPEPSLPERLVDAETYYQSRRLKDHLKAETEYYGRALDLAQDPNSYAVHFEGLAFGNGKAIDAVAPTPLEILGSYLAFPLIDQKDMRDEMAEDARKGETPAPLERLISLPTRGVFAEAKLGHCNVAEEIDETRFWRWDEHPNPFVASDIAPVTPVTPQTIQLDLQGTTLPNPIISIQTSPAAPDPTGMADALKLMAASDVFRDMSGRTEVAGMISNLIDGAVGMAQTAVKAMEAAPGGGSSGVSGGSTTDNGGGPTSSGGGAGSAGAGKVGMATQEASAPKTSPQEAQQQIKVSENQARKNVISPEQHASNVQQSIGQMNGAGKSFKDKKFVFVALDYRRQVSDIVMKASVIDVGAGSVVLASTPFLGNGHITLTFAKADPTIQVRIDTDPVSIHSQFLNVEVPKMSMITPEPITLNATQDIVSVTLTQRSFPAHYQGKTIDEAAQTLVDEYGGKLGISKAVAIELLAKTSKQSSSKTGTETVIVYDLSLPDQTYDLTVK